MVLPVGHNTGALRMQAVAIVDNSSDVFAASGSFSVALPCVEGASTLERRILQ